MRGSGLDAGNLQDVDNRYTWAGRCTLNPSVYCQPDAAAAATCAAQTGGAFGCVECGVGEGTCNVDAYLGGGITTVWDWLNQVNAASYAGHSDWRFPSESGCNSCYTNGAGGLYECTACSAHELETILLAPYPSCGMNPCIDSIFGPTWPDLYWSASTYAPGPTHGWAVALQNGFVLPHDKAGYLYVRAVRDGS